MNEHEQAALQNPSCVVSFLSALLTVLTGSLLFQNSIRSFSGSVFSSSVLFVPQFLVTSRTADILIELGFPYYTVDL